jgi:hypothetical protein
VIEHLPSKCEDLSSIPSTGKQKQTTAKTSPKYDVAFVIGYDKTKY